MLNSMVDKYRKKKEKTIISKSSNIGRKIELLAEMQLSFSLKIITVKNKKSLGILKMCLIYLFFIKV